MDPSRNGDQPDVDLTAQDMASGFCDESIVISGMSGLFPSAKNVQELSEMLYTKINPIKRGGQRWTQKHPEATEYIGVIPDLDRFDSQFFMVHKRLGEAMDPMARKVLEHAFQAIYDAGLNPKVFNGKKVGVYIGAPWSDAEKYNLMQDQPFKRGYSITGSSKSMFANRISYWLNSKGPSITIDNACCGSFVALEEAFNAIKSGIIEAALVGGTSMLLDPHGTVHYNRCIKIAPDGKTRSFDQDANGCSVSEAISVLFLQKAKDALRVYAEVVHIKSEFITSSSEETCQVFGFTRNPKNTEKFLKKFYADTRVSPKDVEYIEAFGSATPEADKAELQSIEKVFCDSRSDPLLVGSVISNIGFTSASSGAVAVTKVLLGYNNGLIASNLHYEKPRQDIAAIQDGRMRVVNDHQPFRGTYAAVNSLSLSGVNSHILLRGYSNPKDLARYSTPIPRLVIVSARQMEYIKYIFEDLKSRPIDAEEVALLQNIHSRSIPGHLGIGYIILDTNKAQETVSLSESIEHCDGARRPLWFVYSGMGSQWAGMGAQLMRIPVFAAAIQRCSAVLEPKGIDLVHIITSPDKTLFDDILNAFVGIAAIQIGITDVLTELGLCPDKIIGHSVGEIGCAYADGCLTAEEVILSGFSRGKASNNATLIRGAMAAVGLGYQAISKLCPPSIDVACHNSESSSTISGPEESVREFVAMLKAKGIFAKEVPTAGIAYHSRYIDSAGFNLLQLMSGLIKEPKVRSERWLSTSVPQDRWDEPHAKYCCKEYLTNNLLNPVLFEETCKLIPSNAVLVEIAPHGLLQAILKRALPNSCTNIPVTQRGHRDNALFLLEAIGKLHTKGYNPQVQNIYPKIKFPVSTGTPHLAHHVKWNHSESWNVEGSKNQIKLSCSRRVPINIHDDEFKYLFGNVVQGRILFPFAGVLMAVWDTLAMTLGLPKKKVSVLFRNVHFNCQPILHEQKQLKLYVAIHRGSGHFEVLQERSKIAAGYIVMKSKPNPLLETEQSTECNIGSDEIYEHLRSRGYFYQGEFRSIESVNESMTTAHIVWNGNWVTFIDGLLQMNTLKSTYDGVSQPAHLIVLAIDVETHANSVQQNKKRNTLLAKLDEACNLSRCGGITLRNLMFVNLPFHNELKFQFVSSTCNDSSCTTTSIDKLTLGIGRVGELHTLHWNETPASNVTGVKVLVHYAGINILDARRALGAIPFDSSAAFGMDFSGVTERGERVMGIVRSGAISTAVVARPELLWPVPPHWTLEEAATVPFAYAQALYYLCIKTNLQRGWKVLIHGATGALGQAAISIALAEGCTVFATVSDRAKKKFLLRLFPELSADAIGNSRDNSFGDMVLDATKGEGCEIVICCGMRNDLKNISLKCVKYTGVTIDMDQIHQKDKFEYEMKYVDRRSYIVADFNCVLDYGNLKELMSLQRLLSEGIARGYVRPLSLISFPPAEVARAFRLVARSRHRGRTLVRLRHPDPLPSPRITCSPESFHLIIWDGASFGFKLVDKLIARNAKKIRLYSLRTKTSPNLLKLQLWKKSGIDVDILNEKNNNKSVPNLDNMINHRGFIEGIYVALTDQDAKLEQDISEIIETLDTASRNWHTPPKYFAVISTNNLVRNNTCVSGHKDGHSAVTLSLPSCKNVSNCSSFPMLNFNYSKESTYEYFWNHSAIDVTELALCSKYSDLRSLPQAVEKVSLLEILFDKSDKFNDHVTVKDLNMDDYLAFIHFYLKLKYHVWLDDKDVMTLTKTKLLQIEMNAIDHKFEKVKGLQIFFSEQDHNELHTTADVIPMNTLMFDVEMMESAFDTSREQLFIIPGMEGLHSRFRALCELLKLPAVVLQPGFDHPNETPAELALRYSKILLGQFKIKNRFYLLGYEFGIINALELAAILEDNGITGTVFCIGDGPKEMKDNLELELSGFSSVVELQDEIVRHVFRLLTGDSTESLQNALDDCFTWNARVDACVRLLVSRVPQSIQYMRALLEASYTRVCVARRLYGEPPRALRSRVVLLRARTDAADSGACSLQRYSRQPLLVRDLAAPLAHAAADPRAPAIINSFLDAHVLDKYENGNLCDPCRNG